MNPKLPKGWKRAHLGDLFCERKESGVDGLPTMSVTLQDGLVLRDELDRKTETTLEPQAHLLVREGDIAYNMMRMWQGACGVADRDCIVSPAYVVLTPNPSVDPRYFVAWFKSARGLHLLWAYSHGLTDDRRRLYFDDFCQVPIDLPPLAEQRRIADALAVWDRAIENADALVVVKRRRKAELVRRLIHRMDLKKSRFGDLFEINPATTRPASGDVSFVAMEDVSEDGFLKSHAKRDVNSIGSGYTPFADGDVLVAKITPCFENGKGALASGLHSGMGFGSTEFHVLRPLDPADAEYIRQHTSAVAFRHNGARYMTGSAGQRRVPAEFIEDYPVPDLPASERRRVANLLADADGEVALLAAEVQSLRTQKRGLMQKLLTGEWRLPARASEAAA